MAEVVAVGLRALAHGRGLALPRRHSPGAAGVDLLAALGPEETLTLGPGERAVIPCGFEMALPEGFEGQVRPRSGLAATYGVTVLNAPGTIDADYRGEVKVILINFGSADFVVRRGERIAQLVVAPVLGVAFTETETLETTHRGGGGLGSTGR